MYLVDTDVVSVGAPGRSPPADLVPWLARNSPKLYISTVSIAEIEAGIASVRRRSARKADVLDGWLDGLLRLYLRRVLPFGLPAARLAGRMKDQALAKGHTPAFPDLAIAATAATHGFTVLTRNVRHFAPLEVPLLNPFMARLPG